MSAPGDIAALALDCDGVLTDGTLLYGPGGEVLQAFSVYDGYGIAWLRASGVEVAILTGRVSPALARRAAALGITRLVQDCSDKAAALRHLAEELGLPLERVAYMGDEIFDLPALRIAGWSAAPANARAEVRAEVNYVCAARGGRGAVREAAEMIQRGRGLWPPAEVVNPGR